MNNDERQHRMESALHEAAASFVLSEANPNPLITITRVSLSPDNQKSAIFFTTIPESREQDALIFLQRTASEMRDFIKKKSKIHTIPHLQFFIDGAERDRQHHEHDQ